VPSAHDLVGSYGLTDRWHRLRVPASSPLIDRSVALMQHLYDEPVLSSSVLKNIRAASCNF
jgi:hypothetical protein